RQRAGPRERGYLHQQSLAHRRRTHGHHDFAPALDTGQRPCHPGDAARQTHRQRPPRRTTAALRTLPAPMEPANKPPVKKARRAWFGAAKGKTIVEYLPDADEIERSPVPRYAQV